MSEFEDAQAAQAIRTEFRHYANAAISYGHVDKDWVNKALASLGIQPITGHSEYRMNVPLTGVFGWRCKAQSRAEALDRFRREVARVADAGKITANGTYDNVYKIEITGEPVVYSGPEDVEVADADAYSLDELKTVIRSLLMEAVTTQGWGHSHACNAAEAMGLESLPSLVTKTVELPVSGTYKTQVLAFVDASDDQVHALVKARIGGVTHLGVEVEELGAPTVKADPFEEPAEDED